MKRNFFFTFTTLNSSHNNISNFFVRIHFLIHFNSFLNRKKEEQKNALERFFQLIHFYNSWKFGENWSVRKLLRANILNFCNVFAWLSKRLMSYAEIFLWQKLANVPWLYLVLNLLEISTSNLVVLREIWEKFSQGILASFCHKKISASDINRLESQAKTLQKSRILALKSFRTDEFSPNFQEL